MRAALAANLGGCLLLGACTTVGPELEPVSVSLPEAYSAPIPAIFEQSEPVDPWWNTFADPALEALLLRGLDANLDVRAAASRVREARAVADGTRARTGPEVTAGGDATAEVPIATEDDDDEAGGSLSLLLDGAYTLDIFGGELRSRQAAEARALQSERLRLDARRQVAGEIARTYLEYRATQRSIALTEQQLELQRRTLELVRNRVNSGLAPGLDLVRAQAAVATLEADLGPLRRDAGRQRNALAVLLGQPPGTLAPELGERQPIPSADAGALLGVPADLLRRRPDVQAAELAVIAATADVGVATAELYPSFSLPASIALGPFGIGAADAVAGVVASIGAAVDMPIYDGGAREADITAAEERLLQATLTYRDTVLTAIQEVEAALLGYIGARERREALEVAATRNRRAYEQSQQLYREGFASFIDVLDSQRELNTSLQSLAQAERDLSLEVVNLYTALGGAVACAPGETPEEGGDCPPAPVEMLETDI